MSPSSNPRRLLILAEGASGDPRDAKTMHGVLRYRREDVVAILDSTRAGEIEQRIPIVADVAAAAAYAPTAALVGVAPAGGRFPPAWWTILRDCVQAGLDIENGLHQFLADDPEFADLAREGGVTLTDLRRPPAGLDLPTGANLRLPGKTVLAVGSDCAIGKMTVSLELDREARARGIASVFVPTGQTGIAIAGWGIAIDAVVADFVAGAVERLVVEGSERGGDLLFVEGQASITHPAYSGETLALMHGSAPHAYVLCHLAGSSEFGGYPGYPLLPFSELVSLHEALSLPGRRATVSCIALNTAHLDDPGARLAIAAAETDTGLVADDPIRFGAGRLLDAVLASVGPLRKH